MSLGASRQEWNHFDLVLGLGSDLLPVVPDPSAMPSPNSRVRQFGKIPSLYDNASHAVGIYQWVTRTITDYDLRQWSADPRLGFCVRASRVRAIDVDAPELAGAIDALIPAHWPRRVRANSPKFLVPFVLDAPLPKRIIQTPHGRIEALGDGQQWVAAGCHPSGARYDWRGGLPGEFPVLTLPQFDALWDTLQQFAVPKSPRAESQPAGAILAPGVAEPENHPLPDAPIDDLRAALAYPPLLAAAADNNVWSSLGYALLGLGDLGRALWMEFSRAAANFEAGAPDTWWTSHLSAAPRADWRHVLKEARRLGWRVTAGAEDFPVEDAPEGAPDVLELDPFDEAAETGRIPDAHYQTTDQANAHRLKAMFGGKKLVVVGGEFFAWTGTHWARSESEAARCAASLSTIIKGEIEVLTAQFQVLTAGNKEWEEMQAIGRKDQSAQYQAFANGPGAEIVRLNDKLDALRRWQKACEMANTQAAAIKILRSTLQKTTQVEFDVDKHLFNCVNCTIDLRTGEMKKHDPRDFISKCAPIKYNRDATAPRFGEFLSEIMQGDADMVRFLQDWFGYCCTGETREQKMVLHVGHGANGKSTLLEVISGVMGGYAKPAPPNILTATKEDRHPTELADLAGARLVTAHESEDGAMMREAFIKQVTGTDRIKARFLYKEFFEFAPTHKIQMLTNYKPTIKGQDHAIWRRMLLVNYPVKFGTEEEVKANNAQAVRDPSLLAQLETEFEGVFKWLIDGAKRWYAEGLKLPRAMTESTLAYRTEQDRLAQFVAERCILDPKAQAQLTGPFDAIYPAYTAWAKESGYQAMGLNKFCGELERVAPTCKRQELRATVNGVRKTTRVIKGLRVNTEGDGGGSVLAVNEDLL